MENIKWTVSIIYQIAETEDTFFFDFLKQDIEKQFKEGPKTIRYYVLKQDELKGKAFILTLNREGELADVLGEHSLKDFYGNSVSAERIWTEFLQHAANNETAKHFLITQGHAAGLGFFSKRIDTQTDKPTSPFEFTQQLSLPDKILVNIQIVLSHSIVKNVPAKDARIKSENFIKHRFDEIGEILPNLLEKDNLGIIPVSVLQSAIAKTYKTKLRFLFLGNCFMQTIENGYLFKDNVQYLAASEGFYFVTGTDFCSLFKLLSSGNEDKENQAIANCIVDGISQKLSDTRIVQRYACTPGRLKKIENGFSFCINDLSKYEDLKMNLSLLASNILDSRTSAYRIVATIREDSRMSRDVFETQFLGLTDLLRFCKNLHLHPRFRANFIAINDCAIRIKMLFESTTSQLIIAQRFPMEAFDPTQVGGVSIFPDGLSVFFPRRKPTGHDENAEFLDHFMQNYYKNNQFITPFLTNNAWRDFVIDYYENSKENPIRKVIHAISVAFWDR